MIIQSPLHVQLAKSLNPLVNLSSQRYSIIEALAKEPRPRGCVKLKYIKNLWRIRIEDYRVIYSIDDRNTSLDVIAIRHRNDAYR
ncbi:MAG: type II toxin-antitoxin system RelE/ParE family toxin [Nitrospirae bacterium]|nr:type II toxin-antitoxin system RelE/ParE family toxin [Nitrospirota bacterium]